MKTHRIYVAVPVIVSEDGKMCGEKCAFRFGNGKHCDLAGTYWDDFAGCKRLPACRAAERRMGKMMADAKAGEAVVGYRARMADEKAKKRGRVK